MTSIYAIVLVSPAKDLFAIVVWGTTAEKKESNTSNDITL